MKDEHDTEQPQEEEVVFLCQFCGKSFTTMSARRCHQEWVCARKDGTEVDIVLLMSYYSCQINI